MSGTLDLGQANKLAREFDGKCMDGIACKNEARGIIVVNQIDSSNGNKRLAAVCYDCLCKRQIESERESKKSAVKELLSDPEMREFLKENLRNSA